MKKYLTIAFFIMFGFIATTFVIAEDSGSENTTNTETSTETGTDTSNTTNNEDQGNNNGDRAIN